MCVGFFTLSFLLCSYHLASNEAEKSRTIMTSSGDYDVRLSMATQQLRTLQQKKFLFDLLLRPSFFRESIYYLTSLAKAWISLVERRERGSIIKGGEEILEGKMLSCDVKASPLGSPYKVGVGVAVGVG